MVTRRVLIIEGEQAIRRSIAPFLTDASFDSYGAATIQDARGLLPVLKPAATIVDRELRDGDGLDLVEDAIGIGSRTVIVSDRNAVADRIKALEMGVDEYLAKPADPQEVFLRLRKLLAAFAEEAAERTLVREFGGISVELASRAILRPDGSPAADLSETEFAVLRLLTQNIDQVVTREALYPIVTGSEYDARPSRAIDASVSRLRLKLRSAGAAADIRSVRQAGYMFRRERGARAGAS